MNGRDLIIFIMFILLILILYNIQKYSLIGPPLKPQFNNYEHFNSDAFSVESLKNIATVYGETSGTAAFNNIRVNNCNVHDTLNVVNLNPVNFRGIIVAWSGTLLDIPQGWALCDGSGGRPDLRGRFILGLNKSDKVNNGSCDASGFTVITPPNITQSGAQVGANLAGVIGSVGGEIAHKLVVNELASHNHTVNNALCMSCNTNNGSQYTGPNRFGGTVASEPAGNDQPHNNLPPFYVMAYIIKL